MLNYVPGTGLFTGEVTGLVGRQVPLETGETMEVSGRLGRSGRYLENSSLVTGGIKSGPKDASSSADCPKIESRSPLS